MQPAVHTHTEVTLATVAISLGLAKLMELIVHAEPILAAVSYLVAAAAGVVTIYYKIKNKGK
jgi:hypothetical protein